MPTILGSGEHRYRVVENWATLPDGWSLTDVAAVAVDSKDRVYVFNRGDAPDGRVRSARATSMRSAGARACSSARTGIHHRRRTTMLYCTDDGDHTVRKCTARRQDPAGPSAFPASPSAVHEQRALQPLHAHRAGAQRRHLRISDGYGNACVHKYAPDGRRLLKTWGVARRRSGASSTSPHNIVCCDADGWVYVADRENHRIQVFNGDGKYETQWNNLYRPCALCACGGGKSPNFIIGELGPGMPVNLKSPNLGPRLTIVDAKGKRVGRLGGEDGPGIETGKFLAPHGIALDSRGDIYLGEVGVTNWKTSFPDTPMPPEVGVVRCLQKLEKI